MKNTKLIALVALLVVVVLVVSVVIATSNDNTLRNDVNNTFASYEEQIAKLNKTLAEVQAGLKSANEALAELKAAGVVVGDFNEATLKFFDKMEELEAEVEKYETAKDEKGNTILNQLAYNDYTGKRDDILENAMFELSRATSVKAMDEIIAGVIESLKALPTLVQEYTTLIEAIEKDGVKVADRENVEKVIALLANNDWTHLGEDDAKAKTALDEKWAKDFAEYKTAATAEFVSMVSKLPKVDALKLTDEKALDDARAQYGHLTSLGLTFVAADDAYKANTSLTELEAREVLLASVKADAETFNASVKTWFDALANGAKFGLNTETLDALDDLADAVAAKIASYETTLNVILDSTKAGFNEYVYNFIDHAAVKAHTTKYDEVKANLSTLADAYLAAVKALEAKKTYADLETANTAAWKAWSAVQNSFGTSNVTAAEVDTYLKNTEGEVAKANTTHNGISGKLYNVKANIDAISAYLASTKKIVCQQPTVHTGTVACDCKTTETTLTLAGIQAIVETNLYPLLTHELNFTEEVIGAELLASLKASYVEAATAAIKATHATVSGDPAYANVRLEEALAQVSVEKLTFAAVQNAETKVWSWAEGYTTLKANLVTWTSAAYFTK